MRAFDPWLGSDYRTVGLDGVRVLILGESQYGSPDNASEPYNGTPTPECRKSTQRIIQECALDHPKAFFTKIAKLLLGRVVGEHLSAAERAALWRAIAFYNFIQWWLPAPRHRPTESMWAAGCQPFVELVQEIHPHVIVVLGRQLSGWLPPLDRATSVVKIAHPSSKGFTYQPWMTNIKQALDTSKGLHYRR
jgi:hypothetical protein